MSSLIDVRNLVKVFPLRGTRAVVNAVNDVSFTVEEGETLGLCGESGSGKTTVGRCILRLIEPTRGQILFRGGDITAKSRHEIRLLRPKLQIVFQDPFDSLNPRLTAGAIIEEPLRLWSPLARWDRRRRIAQLLQSVGLSLETGNAYPHQLGGGEAQRVAIARALASEPEFLVLDEVTSSLDPIARADIIELLMKLQREFGLTYLFISHDLNIVRHVCSRVAIMYLGKLVEVGPGQEIFRDQLHPYSRALLSSVLHPDPGVRRPKFALSGEIPSPIDLPKGCFLYSRCPVAMDRCQEKFPELREMAFRHWVACYKAELDPKWAAKLDGNQTGAATHESLRTNMSEQADSDSSSQKLSRMEVSQPGTTV